MLINAKINKLYQYCFDCFVYYRRKTSTAEVPGTPYRMSGTLEFSSYASIAAGRSEMFEVRSTEFRTQSWQSAAEHTRYKIPPSAAFLYGVPGTSDLICYSLKLLFSMTFR